MATTNLNSYIEQKSTSSYFIEYGGFLTNHLSHGIIAIHRLGAPVSRIDRFVKWYTPKLEDVETDTNDNRPVEELRGERVAYYRILKHYENLLKNKYKNMDELLREEYPKLSLGLAGSALHGTIHVGYGYSVGSERVVLEGLAYVYHSFRPVVSKLSDAELSKFGSGTTDILTVLGEVKDNKTLNGSIEAGVQKERYTSLKVGSFQTRVSYLLAEHGDALQSYALSIKIDEHFRSSDGKVDPVKLSRQMVYWSTLVYAASEKRNDFFLLHGVTCAWSLYKIIPLMRTDDAIKVMRDFATVLIAVYIAEGVPALTAEIKPKNGNTEDDWNAVVEKTLSEDRDEHSLKLVQVCREMVKDATVHGEDPNVYIQAAQNTLENEFSGL